MNQGKIFVGSDNSCFKRTGIVGGEKLPSNCSFISWRFFFSICVTVINFFDYLCKCTCLFSLPRDTVLNNKVYAFFKCVDLQIKTQGDNFNYFFPLSNNVCLLSDPDTPIYLHPISIFFLFFFLDNTNPADVHVVRHAWRICFSIYETFRSTVMIIYTAEKFT